MRHFTPWLLALLSLPATAGAPQGRNSKPSLFSGLTVTKTFDRIKVTHYSATPTGGRPCPLEGGIGGPDESSSGFRPLAHTINRPGLIYGRPATLAALPQQGGTRSAFRCYFALPDAYPGKLFFGGDFYDADSNGLLKADISSPCNDIVNVTKYSKMVIYDCGKQAARVGPQYQKVATREPERNPVQEDDEEQQPPRNRGIIDPRSCPWYAVAECSRRKADLLAAEARLGGEFEIIDTETVPSFARGWYCLVSAAKEKREAQEIMQAARKRAKTPYVKKGC